MSTDRNVNREKSAARKQTVAEQGIDAEAVEVPEDAWDENGFLTEAYLATVPTKGPDPAVWGEDKDRPSPRPEFVATDDDGNEIETKGPDPAQHPNSAE